jgi:nitrogen regulatory protein P-II 1
MKKLEAFIHAFMLDDVTKALSDIGIETMTMSDVLSHAGQTGHKKVYRGQEYVVDMPQIKIELVVSDDRSEEVVSALRGAARSEEIGESRIFISDIADVVRIRTGHRGEFAL